MPLANALQTAVANASLCKAFGIRLVNNPAVVQLARNAGFDALFIDLEHSTLSINDCSQHCTAAIQIGISPFVRVPYQCGNGFVQRVMDGGATGVIFPHIHNKDDARAAVSISKYPPQGTRSMTGQLPLFDLRSMPTKTIVEWTNAHASTVVLMIETADSVANVEDIAAVDGVDVLLIGSNDLAIELEVPGEFTSPVFRDALRKVSTACRKFGKTFGLAGIYDAPDIQGWAVSELGAGFMLVQQDSGILSGASRKAADAVLALTQAQP